MIQQQAQVVRIHDGIASVRVGADTSGCAACDAGKGCGAGIFGRLLRRKPVTLQFGDTGLHCVGQAVMVGIPEHVFLRLVLRMYGLPLISALVGAAFGHQIGILYGASTGWTDALALAGALTGGVASVNWLRRRRAIRLDADELQLLAASDTPSVCGSDIKNQHTGTEQKRV